MLGGGRGRGGLDRRVPLRARPGGPGIAFAGVGTSRGESEREGLLGRDKGLLERQSSGKNERKLGLLGRLRETLQSTATPGVLGRFMSVMWLHPLDTLKTRAQVASKSALKLCGLLATLRPLPPRLSLSAAHILGWQMVAWSSKRTVTTAIYRSPGVTPPPSGSSSAVLIWTFWILWHNPSPLAQAEPCLTNLAETTLCQLDLLHSLGRWAAVCAVQKCREKESEERCDKSDGN